jgi:hypothetical protein
MTVEANGMWAEIEVQKGQLVSVYRGRISVDDFQKWAGGKFSERNGGGALSIHDVYWSSEDLEHGDGFTVLGASAGAYALALGDVHVRGDAVLVIIPLRDGSERDAQRIRSHAGIADA